MMKHGEVTEAIIGCAFEVHRELGAGFVESVYENALAIALSWSGRQVRQQLALQVRFRGQVVGEFRPDLVVDDAVIVEVKAVSALLPAHESQLLNYLKGTGREVGLLINFGRSVEYRRRINWAGPKSE